MPKRKRRGDGLTLKERGFVQDIIKHKEITKAAYNNYNTKSKRNASTIGQRLMKSPRIQYAILDLMDKSGVSDVRLVEKLKEMIFDARKEVLNRDGDVVSLNDNQTQVKALDMAMKIKGAYAPERHEHLGVNFNIYQDLSDEELNERIKLVEAREAALAAREGEAVRA